jgi:vacuolar-type H+-ATPase subunit H
LLNRCRLFFQLSARATSKLGTPHSAMGDQSGVQQLIKAEQRANAMVKEIRLQRHQKMEEAKAKARQLAEDERAAMTAEIDAERSTKLDGEKDRVKGELQEELEREKSELQEEFDTNVSRTVGMISKFVCQVDL